MARQTTKKRRRKLNGWGIERLIRRAKNAGFRWARWAEQAELELRTFRALLQASRNAEIARVAYVIESTPRMRKLHMERVKVVQEALVVAEEVRTGKPLRRP